MVTLNSLYWATNFCALGGWLLLIFYPVVPNRAVLFAGICLPLGLSVAYLCSVFFALPHFSGGFRSIESLSTLYQHPVAVLAGWIHYLAFDLFLGGWQVRRAKIIGLPVAVVIPCLLLTLVFGPVGFLAFYAVQWRWLNNDQVGKSLIEQSSRLS